MRHLIFIFILTFLFSNSQPVFSQNRGILLGDILWQIVVPDNPGTTLQDKQIRSLKQIPDVNGDNVNDVVVATENYWTLCYSGINGNLLWQYSTHFGMINTGSVDWEDAMDISDVNNDGIYDVVIGCGGGNEMVYALNGLNGNVLWSYGNPLTTSDGDIEAVSIRYDYNGDGIKDVLIAASGVTNGGRHAAICLNAVNGNVIFYSTQQQPFTDDLVATESGGAIGVNNNGSVFGVNGFDSTGNFAWSYPVPGNIWSLKEIPDINNDNKKDIVGLNGFNSAIFAITGNTGTQIWSASLGSGNNGKITILDDADSNGFSDFTLSAPQVAYRIDSKTGSIIWSNPLGSSYIRGVDNIGDVTDDNIDDIAIATQLSPRLLVLNGANGKILFDYSFGSTISQRGDRAAVLDDIDSNGVNEILGGNREGRVICFYGGNGTVTSVNSEVSQIKDFTLYQNYPNPFNPSTLIKFDLPERSFVNLKVFDILGKRIAELLNSELNTGSHDIVFDASDLPGGVYYYVLQSESSRKTRSMILVK
ncbi:MAG: PQQ-binding-like beta-propeller repeat protein [Ignavibacteriae bacterium]|nr:PQQ-binding-like beta-propeller repeat protein [Ignavibacteriota bacterium]